MIGFVKAIIPNSSSFQLFNADERFQVFASGPSELVLISSVDLDSRQIIQSVTSAWSIQPSQIKTHILPPLQGNHKRSKTKTQSFLSSNIRIDIPNPKFDHIWGVHESLGMRVVTLRSQYIVLKGGSDLCISFRIVKMYQAFVLQNIYKFSASCMRYLPISLYLDT